MTTNKKTKTAAPADRSAPKVKKAGAASEKSAAKRKEARAKTVKPAAKSLASAKKHASAAKKTHAKTKAQAAKSKKRSAQAEHEVAYRIGESVVDPVGDVTSGEGETYMGDADLQSREEQAQKERLRVEIDAFRTETNEEASDAILEAGPGMEAAQAAMEERARHAAEDKARTGSGPVETDADGHEEAGFAVEQRGPAKLDRLQKILSQAGVASRRRAEEMIVAGRVMVNGQVVTQLGSKADPARDHIRVDGKLLHGAERHRYYVLNKPRGYVTTVSDPEGRPTVMEFFAKSGERVYPVGRLDYQSEGLLLMTNDGELANLLTRAGSGVEKTYLVKVAGQPTAEQIERLRGGVAIEKDEPGSEQVRTAPTRIRQVREGENPWFEIVLIEGRNRELRKMFAAIGHFAEKIRRVGYGPLSLDMEPGKMRELTADEVKALRLTAEGRMKPRRIKTTQMLPREAGVPADRRTERQGRRGGKIFRPRGDGAEGSQWRPGRSDRRREGPGMRRKRPSGKPEEREQKKEWRPRSVGFRSEPKTRPEFRGQRPFGRETPGFESSNRRPFKPGIEGSGFGSRPRREFPAGPPRERDESRFGDAPRGSFKSGRPQWKRDGETKPHGEFAQRREFGKGFGGQRGSGFNKAGKFGGGKTKPAYGSPPRFGGKPGAFGNFRSKSDGAKRGFSRPGAQRSGWKRS